MTFLVSLFLCDALDYELFVSPGTGVLFARTPVDIQGLADLCFFRRLHLCLSELGMGAFDLSLDNFLLVTWRGWELALTFLLAPFGVRGTEQEVPH